MTVSQESSFDGRGIGAVLPGPWQGLAQALRHDFQPIAQMRTGRVHGYEALLRGWESLGFETLDALFAQARDEGVLAQLEGWLTARARERFRDQGGVGRLFVNLNAQSWSPGWMTAWVPSGPGQPQVVFEMRGRVSAPASAPVGGGGVLLALDGFGEGEGDFRRLLDWRPTYVKVPPYFLERVERDQTRRAVVAQMVAAAHAIGQSAIAVGIETREQFYACRDLGFDYAQGFLLGMPGNDVTMDSCSAANDLGVADRRRPDSTRTRLRELIEPVRPLRLDAPKATLLDYFGVANAPPVVPVLDAGGKPCGLVLETHLKPFVYSRYGGEILRNRSFGRSLADFVVPCPICDIGTPLERVLELVAEGENAPGAIIVEGGDYVGLLSSQALVRLLHERRLAVAVDQNPLSRLPGNNAITAQVENILADEERQHTLAYLDFDNFKPFNDKFGFRQGDRAILMFSDQFKVFASGFGGFAGHVGGDDFFLSATDVDLEQLLVRLKVFLSHFASDVESLYDQQTRQRGWFDAYDRDGAMRRFPLLKVSAVVVCLPPGANRPHAEGLVELIAAHKARAKAAEDNVCVLQL